LTGVTLPSAPDIQTPAQGTAAFGERVSETIGVDRRLNAIVVFGDEKTVDLVRAAVAQLDVPLSSVLLEVKIFELTESAARDVGIDYSPSGELAQGSLVTQTMQSANSSATLSAAVFAAISRGSGKLIATPRIVALDGRIATILTGDQIPIVTTVSYPSTGSSVVQQQVQYLTVGVNVQIRPQISDEGAITTHIYANVSSVSGYVQGYPQLSQRFASTVASMQDGQSLVIGGLLQESELRSFKKVPFVGDLPIIGKLFQLTRDSGAKTNLYIVVTPHVTAPRKAD
jgi:general secretion pathway protein D